MKWIRVAQTRLAKEMYGDLRRAGHLLSKAGFAKKKMWNSETKSPIAHVDISAANLSKAEVENLAGWKPEKATPTVKRAELNMPSYSDLVKVVEDLTALNELLKEKLAQTEDECRQLRKLTNPVNGMKDRAKKALVHAERTLKLYD